MSWLVALPIMLPLATASVALLGRRSRAWQAGVSLLGAMALLGCASALLAHVDAQGFAVLHVGQWPAPFGIALAADRFSAIMVLVTAIAGLVAMLYALAEQRRDCRRGGPDRPMILPVMHMLLMGVCGAFLTADLFNLYVWFEVLLMASFVLLALGNTPAQLSATLKYVCLNLLSSAFFLVGAGLLYGLVGTLNMADLARIVPTLPPSGDLLAVSALFLAGFGIKAALFPVFFWLPASYHTPSFAASALFAALLTKVGMYSIYRTFTGPLAAPIAEFRDLLGVLAAASMVVGVLGAASQMQFRRILAFHSVSQMGYLLMGLAVGTPAALAAGIFFFLHHALVKANLFLVAGAVHHATGSNHLKDDQIAGLMRRSPLLAVAFLVTALSLAGLPPMSGFPAKLGLIIAGVDQREWLLVGVATGVGLLTLFSMVKIWAEVFWREPPSPAGRGRHADGHHPHVPHDPHDPHADHADHAAGAPPPGPAPRLGAMLSIPFVLAVGAVALGVFASPVLDLCRRAADQLADPGQAIRAVDPKPPAGRGRPSAHAPATRPATVPPPAPIGEVRP